MDNNTDQEKHKEKKRVIPFIWWFGGAAVGGGLIALAVLLANKTDQVNDLEQKLAETEATLLREKEIISIELSLSQQILDTLETRYDALSADLSDAEERNARLASVNVTNGKQISNYRNENAALQESIDRYLTENQSLNEKIGALGVQVEDLQSQLTESNTNNEMQAGLISDQNERITTDSVAMVEDALLREAEDVSGYFNNTEVTGAAGLAITSVPYAKYFYGISIINGYVINKRFSTGVGVGLNSYNEGLMAPVYLDFRYNLRKSGYIPYLFADGGLMLLFEDMKESEIFINPGVGVFRSVSDKLAVNLGAGWFIQSTPAKASFVNFRLGLIFLGRKEDRTLP